MTVDIPSNRSAVSAIHPRRPLSICERVQNEKASCETYAAGHSPAVVLPSRAYHLAWSRFLPHHQSRCPRLLRPLHPISMRSERRIGHARASILLLGSGSALYFCRHATVQRYLVGCEWRAGCSSARELPCEQWTLKAKRSSCKIGLEPCKDVDDVGFRAHYCDLIVQCSGFQVLKPRYLTCLTRTRAEREPSLSSIELLEAS